MVDPDIGVIQRIEPPDGEAFFARARITFGSQHDTECGTVVPYGLFHRTPVGHPGKNIVYVALRARQYHLRLGVAETGIEFIYA